MTGRKILKKQREKDEWKKERKKKKVDVDKVGDEDWKLTETLRKKAKENWKD